MVRGVGPAAEGSGEMSVPGVIRPAAGWSTVGRMPTIAIPRPLSVGHALDWARRPAVTDTVLALGLTAVGMVTAEAGRLSPGRVGAVLLLAAPLPLLLLVRRRYPIAVCAALAVGTLLATAIGYPQVGVLAFAV